MTPVGLFLAHTLRSEASASRVGAMHAWRYSWNLVLTLVMSQRAAEEKEAVTWTFNLKRSIKDNPSKVSNTSVAEIWNNSSVLLQASCALASSKQRQVTSEEVSSSVLFIIMWLISGSSKSFMERTTCSSCALCTLCRQASLYKLPSHTHTAPSDIKKVLVLDQLQAPPCDWLRTIWKSRAAQEFETTTDRQSDGVSNHRSTRRLEIGNFLGHAQEFV